MARKRKKPVSSLTNSQSPLPRPQGSQPRQVVEIQERHISGPLPTPALLKEFDDVVPGCAERIIRMAEEQAKHRQLLEKTVIIGDSKRANQGLWVGGTIAFLFLAGAVFLIYNGHDWAGGVLASVDLVSIVGVFIYGTVSRRSERIQKAKTMNPSTQNPKED